MRRAAAGSIIALLSASAAACGGKTASNDSAVEADRAAAATDTSGTGATMSSDSSGPGASAAAGAPSGRPTRAVTTPPGAPSAAGGHGPSNAMSIRPSANADTLRGTVSVVGATPGQVPVIRPNGGGATVTLAGPLVPVLSRLSGTDVWVSGTRQGTRSIDVDRFVVRAVGGVPAMDGTLTSRDGGLAIMITGEHVEHPIANPPAALKGRVGQRVWITGDPQKTIASFGVIDERP